MTRVRTTRIVSLLLLAAPALAQAPQLQFSDKLRLVNCEPASRVPCFRVKVNILDDKGNPLATPLPPEAQLAKSITVRVNDVEVTPFFASAGGGPTAVRSRIALILIDISGSMNQVMPNGQTRFSAATTAALQFLKGFDSRTDRVAVVPFESHRVVETIRAAVFASSLDEARRQIHSIPLPQKGNTALFSAVEASLDVLLEQMKKVSGSPEVMLVVMTDGKNDIRPGDDPGLLEGPSGLAVAAGKVRSAGIQVIGIGLGDSSSIDTEATRQISTRFHLVSDPESLKQVFSMARELLVNRLQATFTSPWPDRASLAGQTLRVQMALKLPSGQEAQSNDLTWSTPQMGLPLFEGKCEPAESRALLRAGGGEVGAVWWAVLRPVLVFVSVGAAILVLWFWVPRLVWPEQYMGEVPVRSSPGKWAGPTQAPRGPGGVGRTAPPGFTRAPGARPAPERGPADPTIVRPKTETGTRTRLYPRTPPGEY